ncbi:LysR substrate-binding domain-containing protein [Albimonas sp. CAU 1670]|uniref:LysR substrate-binding domain-containing protein n=1 Tax=Albimonas sp. CAU 1670 TaxID=3032599 RepID=UPI0023DC22C8|nr:LysR substrate-binding domain-containing protein [Albimonas sp. CAU 1670]MDF2231352.1 LysR substrate-binding domain-containing protein [Albimonas sp. CAU 1670]
MTLEQLRIFLAVAERGHMTRAAQALSLTQSAVSAAVAALESRHRVRLFDRVGRGIALTEEGRAFVDAARATLAQAEAAELLLEDFSRLARGRLRLRASQTVAGRWLPPRLVALHERHPGVEIELTVGNTAEAARAVAEGAADLGFVEGALPASDLRRQVVARDELALAMPLGHPGLRLPRPGPDDYRAWTWILREDGSGTRSEFEAHLATMGLRIADLTRSLTLPSNEAVAAAVAAGGSVAMLSRRAAGPAPEAQGLVMRRVDWAPPPHRPFAVISDPRRRRTRAVEAMLAVIEEMRGEDDGPEA